MKEMKIPNSRKNYKELFDKHFGLNKTITKELEEQCLSQFSKIESKKEMIALLKEFIKKNSVKKNDSQDRQGKKLKGYDFAIYNYLRGKDYDAGLCTIESKISATLNIGYLIFLEVFFIRLKNKGMKGNLIPEAYHAVSTGVVSEICSDMREFFRKEDIKNLNQLRESKDGK